MGPANVSQSQMECLPWAYQSADLMLTDGDGQSSNMCRNPSNQLEKSPYCYSKSLNNTFGQVEVCKISYCGKLIYWVFIFTLWIAHESCIFAISGRGSKMICNCTIPYFTPHLLFIILSLNTSLTMLRVRLFYSKTNILYMVYMYSTVHYGWQSCHWNVTSVLIRIIPLTHLLSCKG